MFTAAAGCVCADVEAATAAASFLSALSGYNGIGGAILATSDLASPHSPADDVPPPVAAELALARLAAATHALAPGAAYITRLDAVPAEATLRLVALAGAAFAHVQLLRPVATPADGGATWLLATHRRLLAPEDRAAFAALGGLNPEALSAVGAEAPAAAAAAAGNGGEVEVPESLRESFEAACVWEAERAEADLAVLELIYEGGEDAQVLDGAGQRWGSFVALDGLTVETRDPHAVRCRAVLCCPGRRACDRSCQPEARQHV